MSHVAVSFVLLSIDGTDVPTQGRRNRFSGRKMQTKWVAMVNIFDPTFVSLPALPPFHFFVLTPVSRLSSYPRPAV